MLHRFSFMVILFIFITSLFNISSNLITCKAKEGNTFYVGGSSVGNYTHIQDAVDNSSDDDTIFVYNGTYHENLVINKSINLVGLDKNSTFISYNESLYVILIKSSWVNITRLTILNGKIGIYIVGPKYSHNSITNNIILNNWEGIRLYNSSNNNISGNIINDHTNFGIISYESRNNLFLSNKFIDNYKGIFFGRWSDDNIISENNFTKNVYGISLDYSFNNLIYNNSITNNTMGISLKYSSNNNATNNTIKNNNQCGIYLSNSDYNIILPNTFFNNYQDIKEGPKPPMIKAPSFEILFVICAILFVLFLSKKTKKF